MNPPTLAEMSFSIFRVSLYRLAAGEAGLGAQLTSPEVDPSYVSSVVVPNDTLFGQPASVATLASGELALRSLKNCALSRPEAVAMA